MGFSGKNLFNIFSNSGIVQTKINTPKILKTICALANARSIGAFLLMDSIKFKAHTLYRTDTILDLKLVYF